MTRLHVVGVPTTDTTADNTWDGHSSMVRKFAAMCHQHGHEVLLYAGETNDAECKEHIPLVTNAEQHRWFDRHDIKHNLAAVPGLWDNQSSWWQTMNTRAATAIRERQQPGDLLALIGGSAQLPLADALPTMRSIEYAVGYEGPIAAHCCYATNAWRQYLHGKWGRLEGRFYDTVIPHPFDPDDFHLAPKDDYLLYLGRLTCDKGVWIANDIAERTGRRLLLAGQGSPRLCPAGEYLGVVSTEERADLLARARAVLVPSLYVEPFGNVVVEAMLSGTPVITTNWGGFPELVEHGVTGFRCDTLAEFCAAAEAAEFLDPAALRYWAINRYSADVVAPQYGAWFDRIATLDHAGWYT